MKKVEQSLGIKIIKAIAEWNPITFFYFSHKENFQIKNEIKNHKKASKAYGKKIK